MRKPGACRFRPYGESPAHSSDQTAARKTTYLRKLRKCAETRRNSYSTAAVTLANSSTKPCSTMSLATPTAFTMARADDEPWEMMQTP